jgi:hypothetical protein
MIRNSLLLLFISFFSNCFAQTTCESIAVKVKVIDTLRPQSFYHMVIYNKTQGTALFGQPDGWFTIQAKINDTIVVAVKEYPKETFIVNEENYCRLNKVIVLKYKSKKLNEVILRPIKTAAEIKEQRQKLALEKTRSVTGVEVLQSPITFLYESFSKKERNKRWVAEARYMDKQRELVKEYVRTCNAYKVINLYEHEMDDFVDFLNMDSTFFKTASDYSLVLFVKKKFQEFRAKN